MWQPQLVTCDGQGRVSLEGLIATSVRQVVATRLEDGAILLQPLQPEQAEQVADLLGTETAHQIAQQSDGPATRLNLPARQAARRGD